MGSSDRDYFRDEAKRYGSGGISGGGLPPVSKGLLVILVLVGVLSLMMGGRSVMEMGMEWGELLEGKVWKLVLFPWVQESLLGLLFVGLVFYFLSPYVERWWGAKGYVFYLLLVVMATLAGYAVIRGLGLTDLPLYGSSGWTMAMLLSLAVIDPNVRVRLWVPPVELSMRTMVWVMLGISVVMSLVNLARWPEMGWMEVSHYFGAAAGWALTRWPAKLGKGRERSAKVVPFRRGWSKPKMSGVVEVRKSVGKKVESKMRPRTTVDFEETAAVDRILEKIHREGIGSLTKAEKDLLEKAAKKDGS